jgi:hypothetical protein
MSRFTKLSLAGALLTGILIAVIWIGGGADPPPARQPPPVEPTPVPQRPTDVRLPAFDSRTEVQPIEPPRAEPRSPDVIEAIVKELSTHPQFAAWLIRDDLLRRFVSAIESIAEGYSPRDELQFVGPMAPFVVQKFGEELVISPGCFHRFDVITDVFCSLDTSGAVTAYRYLKPNIAELHRSISWVSPDFDERLLAAIDHLLEVPVDEEPLTVKRGVVRFTFVDDDLERLTDAQRQLLRMGPENARRIQLKLSELRTELKRTSSPDLQASMPSSPPPAENSRAGTKQASCQKSAPTDTSLTGICIITKRGTVRGAAFN